MPGGKKGPPKPKLAMPYLPKPVIEFGKDVAVNLVSAYFGSLIVTSAADEVPPDLPELAAFNVETLRGALDKAEKQEARRQQEARQQEARQLIERATTLDKEEKAATKAALRFINAREESALAGAKQGAKAARLAAEEVAGAQAAEELAVAKEMAMVRKQAAAVVTAQEAEP